MNFKKELFRKLLHLPGLVFLLLAKDFRGPVIGVLLLLTGVYFFSEASEKKWGKQLTLFSALKNRLRRGPDLDLGPPLLALGISAVLALFEWRLAALGVLQVCVSDAAASLAGLQWGKQKIFYSPQKSYVGSLAFFLTAFVAQLFFIDWPASLLLALLGTVIESLPLKAWDNLVLPLLISLCAFWISK